MQLNGEKGQLDTPKNVYLKISGRIYYDNQIFLRPSYLSSNPRDSVSDEHSAVRVELYDKNDELLFNWGASIGSLCIDPIRISDDKVRDESKENHLHSSEALNRNYQPLRAKVPYHPETRKIIIRKADTILKEILVPEHKPIFVKHRIEKRQENYHIEWQVEHPDKLDVFYHIRASADAGRTWFRLESRLSNPKIVINRESLAGGKNCLLEIVAYDGVNTVPFRIPISDAPPIRLIVNILSPLEEERPVMPPIQLRAFGVIRGLNKYDDSMIDYTWLANGKEVGKGSNAIWYPSESGIYEILLHARSAELESKASVHVNVK